MGPWKERGMPTVEKKQVKQAGSTVKLFEAVGLLGKVSILSLGTFLVRLWADTAVPPVRVQKVFPCPAVCPCPWVEEMKLLPALYPGHTGLRALSWPE